MSSKLIFLLIPPLWNYEILETEDNSFIAFADEIMAMYY